MNHKTEVCTGLHIRVILVQKEINCKSYAIGEGIKPKRFLPLTKIINTQSL